MDGRRPERVDVANPGEFLAAAKLYFEEGVNFTATIEIAGKVDNGWETFEIADDSHPNVIILEKTLDPDEDDEDEASDNPLACYVCVVVNSGSIEACQWAIVQGMYDYKEDGYDALIDRFF